MAYPIAVILVVLFPLFVSVVSFFLLRKHVKSRPTLILTCGAILLFVILCQLFFVRFKKNQPLPKTIEIKGEGQRTLRTDIKQKSTLVIKKMGARKNKKEMLTNLNKKLSSGEITEEQYNRALKFISARSAK